MTELQSNVDAGEAGASSAASGAEAATAAETWEPRIVAFLCQW